MALKRCDAGHYYDPAQNSSCPHCGIPGLDLGATAPKMQEAPAGADRTVPNPPTPVARPQGGGGMGVGTPPDEARTVGIVQKQLGVDPVVGWLVCIEGPERGTDYRLRSGRNFIGRSREMHVCIAGDSSISREKHAIVSFDPKKRVFKVLPGDSSGLTYLNDETVDVPEDLNAFDLIEVGETKLQFVPFCGDRFQWDSAGDS